MSTPSGLRAPIIAALAVAAAWMATQLRAADPAQATLNLGVAGAGRDLALVGLMLCGVVVGGRFAGLGRFAWVAYPLLVAVGFAWVGGDAWGIPSSSRRLYLGGLIAVLALASLVRLAVRLDPEPGRWSAVVLALAMTQVAAPLVEPSATVPEKSFRGVGEPEFPNWLAFGDDRFDRQRLVWLSAGAMLVVGAFGIAVRLRANRPARGIMILCGTVVGAWAGYQASLLLGNSDGGRWSAAWAGIKAYPFGGAPAESWAARLVDGSAPGGFVTFPLMLGIPAAILCLVVIVGGLRFAGPVEHLPPAKERTLGTRFYVGGLLGCLLAFLAADWQAPPGSGRRESLEIGTRILVRSFVWIAAFAAFDRLIFWAGPTRRWLTPALAVQLALGLILPTLLEGECLALFALAFAVRVADPIREAAVSPRSALADAPYYLGVARDGRGLGMAGHSGRPGISLGDSGLAGVARDRVACGARPGAVADGRA